MQVAYSKQRKLLHDFLETPGSAFKKFMMSRKTFNEHADLSSLWQISNHAERRVYRLGLSVDWETLMKQTGSREIYSGDNLPVSRFQVTGNNIVICKSFELRAFVGPGNDPQTIHNGFAVHILLRLCTFITDLTFYRCTERHSWNLSMEQTRIGSDSEWCPFCHAARYNIRPRVRYYYRGITMRGLWSSRIPGNAQAWHWCGRLSFAYRRSQSTFYRKLFSLKVIPLTWDRSKQINGVASGLEFLHEFKNAERASIVDHISGSVEAGISHCDIKCVSSPSSLFKIRIAVVNHNS